MDRWHLIRTAHHLGKLGTISATAKALGIHRATVLRHIDALEAELGVKLFLRGNRGYTPTEDGEDLMGVAGATEEQFGQLFNRLKQRSQPLSGEFIVTSLEALVPVLMPLLTVFQKRYPAIQLRYLSSKKVFRLEFGEAHVAVRTGVRPQVSDNVVIPFATQKLTLYAHPEYLAQYGRPNSFKAMAGHKFIGFEKLIAQVSVHKWIVDNIREEDIVLKSDDDQVRKQALINALGIGFMGQHEAKCHPQMVELFTPLKEWEVDHWLVTHSDLHRSAKVQAFLKVFRELTEHNDSFNT